MNHLRERYDALPEDAKDRFFAHVHKALLWRGWARMSPGLHPSCVNHVHAAAEVFRVDGGQEIEEYT